MAFVGLDRQDSYQGLSREGIWVRHKRDDSTGKQATMFSSMNKAMKFAEAHEDSDTISVVMSHGETYTLVKYPAADGHMWIYEPQSDNNQSCQTSTTEAKS